MSATATDDFVGRQVLGRYRILRLLATGGMGKIYLARSEGAEGFVKPVVVKRVLPNFVGDDSMVKMFVREARILSTLRHPGIVAVTDFAREGDDYLMAMEYVHGYNLARWLRYVTATRGLFPVEVAVHVAIAVLEALHYAHTLTAPDGKSLAVVHRDVTPSNVLIDSQGHVKLLDFGIARSATDATEPHADRPAVKGKFPYIAPDVLSGGEPSPRSDVYSAGVLLYEVLAGRNPFLGKDMPATVHNVIKLVPPPLHELRDDVPPELSSVIARAFAKDPNARFASAHEFAVALRAVRGINTDEANAEIARLAALDFASPEMAEVSGTDGLTTLDRAWRASLPPATPGALPGPAAAPPVAAAPPDGRAGGGLSVARGGARWLAVGSAAVALAAISALVAVVMTRERRTGATPFVYIQNTATDAAGGGTEPEPGATGDAPDASLRGGASVAPSPGRDAGRVPRVPGTAVARTQPVDRSAALSRTFAGQQARITSCFERNRGDVAGSPEVAVRFRVGTNGRVGEAQVLPSSLASTAFASCILGVARGVDFGRQSEPIVFRIPITVRRAGR